MPVDSAATSVALGCRVTACGGTARHAQGMSQTLLCGQLNGGNTPFRGALPSAGEWCGLHLAPPPPPFCVCAASRLILGGSTKVPKPCDGSIAPPGAARPRAQAGSYFAVASLSERHALAELGARSFIGPLCSRLSDNWLPSCPPCSTSACTSTAESNTGRHNLPSATVNFGGLRLWIGRHNPVCWFTLTGQFDSDSTSSVLLSQDGIACEESADHSTSQKLPAIIPSR